MGKGMKTKEQCLQRYREDEKKRRALAIRMLDGKLKESDFEHRWQYYDVKAEAIMLKQQREEARKKAEEAQRQRDEHNRNKRQLGFNL